jgi:hypothetical protein
MMKASYPFLIIGSVAALAWWGYASLSPEKHALEKQTRSRNVSRATSTSANSTDHTLQPAAACSSEPTERCGSPQQSTSDATLEQELVTLRRQVARLDTELVAVRRRLDSSGPSGGNTSPSSPDPEIDEAEARAQEQQEWQERIAATEWSFRQEPVEAAWAAHATAKIHQAYEREELVDFPVQAVECRSTLCRVEVALDEQTNQLLPLFARYVGDTFPRVTVKPIADGDERVVLFLSRGGQG